jgi:hypothetical protein
MRCGCIYAGLRSTVRTVVPITTTYSSPTFNYHTCESLVGRFGQRTARAALCDRLKPTR